MIKMFKRQELYLHLDHVIEHVLDDTFAVRISWEHRDFVSAMPAMAKALFMTTTVNWSKVPPPPTTLIPHIEVDFK